MEYTLVFNDRSVNLINVSKEEFIKNWRTIRKELNIQLSCARKNLWIVTIPSIWETGFFCIGTLERKV